ncbi:spore germination protein [Proteinivorax hydrogeniformans]|uniref:Spore germination protein n=1 Tax=Proteinivorax hydrogeniformans TaxID=1826727 RepID=A0AAU8HQH3_9FIRM
MQIILTNPIKRRANDIKKNFFSKFKQLVYSLLPKEPSPPQAFKEHFEKGDTKGVFNSLNKNTAYLNKTLSHSDDIVFRTFKIPTIPPTEAAIVFYESLIDEQLLESSVLTPLTSGISKRTVTDRTLLVNDKDLIVESGVTSVSFEKKNKLSETVDEILMGQGVLFLDNHKHAISINLNRDPERSHAEPKTEKVVKGPQQGFVEDIEANTSILRKRIHSKNLVVKNLIIGTQSKTRVAVAYMDNIADPNIVKELFSRLEQIKVDAIMGSSYIEEYITDSPGNIFPTTLYTERPDRLQMMLVEGRIAIICDGTPFVVVAPAIVSDFFVSASNYYQHPYFASFSRSLAYLGAFVLTFLPSFYIAIVTYHQEMIPTRLALTIAGTRAGVPFPAFVEALIMELAFEGLREAGAQIPTQLGQAISIVGALIIGQAAVEAGLVSPAVVIVVATTAIFSFTIPFTNFSLSLRLIRFFNMGLAATLGIYGVMTGALIILINLLSLRSLGVPFMMPFAPANPTAMKDWFLRLPQWSIKHRSSQIVKGNLRKKSDSSKPSPPKQKGDES